MPKEDNFIVAIELGSSKVTAIAGRKQPDGAIQVLASAQEPSESFIRKGRINNFNKMTSCIERIKGKLENTLHKSISSTYVGIGGMGMHTVRNTVARTLGEKLLITAEMVDNVKEANQIMPNGDREILDVILQEYRLGTQTVSDPIGIASDNIEGRFLNIIASSSVTKDVRDCFNRAGLNVVGLPISVLTQADAILTEPEKRSGCVFVDMGAETTSVAIYKNNVLRHLAVIPLGGANINRDLCTLQIEDSEAEALKRKYAAAYRDENDAEEEPITLNDGRSVKFEEFSGLAEARMEEIIANINNQIALSKYSKTELIAGIVVTGGASNIKNIDKAFTTFTSFEKLRFVKNLRLQYRVDSKSTAGFNTDGSYNTAIALIEKGEINCCGGDFGTDAGLFNDNAQTTPAHQPSASNIAAGTTVNGQPVTGQTGKPQQTTETAAEKTAEEAEAAEKPAQSRKWIHSFKNSFRKLAKTAGKLVDDNDEGPFSDDSSKKSEK